MEFTCGYVFRKKWLGQIGDDEQGERRNSAAVLAHEIVVRHRAKKPDLIYNVIAFFEELTTPDMERVSLQSSFLV